nr:ribonuclease H-like domain-containing protein [Tanacetum cinerariifolium]
MDHSNPTFAKILILNTGKFEQWKFRIQQYLQSEHYALWEVIEFGDSYNPPPEETGKGPTSESSTRKKGRTVAITMKDMQKRKNDVKARTTLLLALLDEHQLRFSKYEIAKELLQAIVSHLEFMDVEIEQDDLNQKFLTKFGDSYEALQEESGTESASESSAKKKGRIGAILKTFGGNEATKKTKKNQLKQQYGNFKEEGSGTLEQTFNRLQAIISHMEFIDRNRSDLDTMSLDDLYNHLKVYEPEVQKKSQSNSQNMAFISSAKNNSRKGEVNTASIPIASTHVSPTSADVAAASISLDTVCAYIASQSNGSQIKYEYINQIDKDDIEEMDIKWNMPLLSMRADRFWKKTGKKITIQGTDVAGFDKSKVECFNCHKMGHFTRECKAPRSQDKGRREIYKQENHALVADEEALTEYALMAKSSSSSENEVFDNSLCSKSCKKNTDSLNTKITNLDEALSDSKTNLYHYKLALSQVETRLVEFKTQEIKFCEKIRGLEFDLKNKNIRIERITDELEQIKKEKEVMFPPPAPVYSPPKKDMSWIGLPEFAYDTITDYSWPLPSVETSDIPIVIKTNKVETVRKPFIKYAEMAIPRTSLMIKDIGTVTRGGKITGKGIIKIGKLEFENVYFVKDLKYNMFSVSQICDNKNSVLFTDSECIVLGRDFKLKDDTNVLLRTPRQHNMYSIDLNNIVPHKDLTCLVVKASADESMLLHRRLGIKDAASQDVKKDVSSLRYIALPNWFHEAHLEFSTSNAQDACNADAPESSENSNPTATTKNPPTNQMETLTVESAIPTVSSLVPTACLEISPETTSGDTNGVEADLGNMKYNISASPTPTFRIHKDHPKSQIIGPMDSPVQTRHKSKEMEEQSFIATIHQKITPDLLQFCLFSRVRPIRIKWVLKNKKNKRGIVIRNKARLVAQGYTHEERIDYEEVFAPVAKIEAIRLFLAYASFMGFTVYQMDVKSAFLYDTIDEEVYVM